MLGGKFYYGDQYLLNFTDKGVKFSIARRVAQW